MDKQLPATGWGRGWQRRGRSKEERAASREEGLTTSNCWAREGGEGGWGIKCANVHVCVYVCRRGSMPGGAIWLLDRALLINREVNCCGSTQPVSNITPGT